MEYKVKVKKMTNYGSNYQDVNLSITEESQLSDFLDKYFKADFNERSKMLQQ